MIKVTHILPIISSKILTILEPPKTIHMYYLLNNWVITDYLNLATVTGQK